MYRPDFVADKIYTRAKSWTKASFMVVNGQNPTGDRPFPRAYFTNNVTVDLIPETSLLVCDREPHAHPRSKKVEVLFYREVDGHMLGWASVGGGTYDPDQSGRSGKDITIAVQSRLNRLRVREAVLRIPPHTVPLFRPDFGAMVQIYSFSQSDLRAFFDWKLADRAKREAILWDCFRMRPEQLELNLWES